MQKKICDSLHNLYFPDSVISGAVKLWLEQEGEAQLCSKCCGLYLQVQPGETGNTIYPYCPFSSSHSKASAEKEGKKKDEKQSCSKFIDLCVLAIKEWRE